MSRGNSRGPILQLTAKRSVTLIGAYPAKDCIAAYQPLAARRGLQHWVESGSLSFDPSNLRAIVVAIRQQPAGCLEACFGSVLSGFYTRSKRAIIVAPGEFVSYRNPFSERPRPAQVALPCFKKVLGVNTGQAVLAAGGRLVISTLKNHGVGCGARVVAEVHRWLADQRQREGDAVPTTTQAKAKAEQLLAGARQSLAGANRRRLVDQRLKVDGVARTCGSPVARCRAAWTRRSPSRCRRESRWRSY